ncbi:MAG: DUF2974 domain-containing protein [bacterium]|nr:DUF2974 domain-containing protein [bacterium]
MVSDRDCINLSDIAYLDLNSKYKYPTLFDDFIYTGLDGKLYIRDEITNSSNPRMQRFVKDLKNFYDYYEPTLQNYRLFASESNSTNGYQGLAFVNVAAKEVVLANRGTLGTVDFLNDTMMATANLPPQFYSATDFYEKVRNFASRKSYSITLTGHSLGGSLATFQMLKYYGDSF